MSEQLNFKIEHEIEKEEPVKNLQKILEAKNLNLYSFAIKKKKAASKIQYDPWGNPYKTNLLLD